MLQTGGGDAKSPVSPGPCPIPEVSRWLLTNVHLHEKDVLERRAAYSMIAATWRLESVSVKIAAENADLASRPLDDPATRKQLVMAVASEAAFLSSLRHDRIVHLYGVMQHPKSGLPCLVLERLYESVEQRRRRGAAVMTLKDIVDVSMNICDALYYLHHEFKPAVAHRDLSSKTVLLTGTGQAKLGGLSSARALAGKQPATKLPGADEYMPPETALGDMPVYSTKIDNFSIGVLMIELVVNKPPTPKGRFISKARGVAIVPEIKRRAEELAMVKDTQPRMLPVIQLCLQEEKRRPNSIELDAALKNVQSTIDYLESRFTLCESTSPPAYDCAAGPSRVEGSKSPPKPQRSFPMLLRPRPVALEKPSPRTSNSSLTASTTDEITYDAPCDTLGDGDGYSKIDNLANVDKGYSKIDGLALTIDGTVRNCVSPDDDSPSEWDSESPTYDSVDETDLDKIVGRRRSRRGRGGANTSQQPVESTSVDELAYEDGYRVPADCKLDGYFPTPDDSDHVYQDVAVEHTSNPKKNKPRAKKPVGTSISNPTYANNAAVSKHKYEEIPNVSDLMIKSSDGAISAPLPPLAMKFHSQLQPNDQSPGKKEAKAAQIPDTSTIPSSASTNRYVTAPWTQQIAAHSFTASKPEQAKSSPSGIRRASDGDSNHHHHPPHHQHHHQQGPPLPGGETNVTSRHVSFDVNAVSTDYETPEAELLEKKPVPPRPAKTRSNPDLSTSAPRRPPSTESPKRVPKRPVRTVPTSPPSQAEPNSDDDYEHPGTPGMSLVSMDGSPIPGSVIHGMSCDDLPPPPTSPPMLQPGLKSPSRSHSALMTLPPVAEQQGSHGSHGNHVNHGSHGSSHSHGTVTGHGAHSHGVAHHHARPSAVPPQVRSPPTRRYSSDDVIKSSPANHHESHRAATDSGDWFHGPLSREEAEEKLRTTAVGCFLVRSGRTHAGFTISWRSAQAGKAVKHVIVDQPRPGVFQLRHSLTVYSSMEDLIRHHRMEPLTNVVSDVLGAGVSP
ncbi:uncharacterized protein LOC135808927 [Sycon ciliatum]|uniref:uncharacterized protein LOC135808927 n=1 Tax=Sycon ciliatum TaxID=27933 RepID=UPI0020AADDE0|eukprot:scpid13711/ scgid34888/ Leucine-rich repeat receptor-like serine/threonine-protein kinase At1g17230